MAYKRSSNQEFNLYLEKRLHDGERKHPTAAESQANVDKWLADESTQKNFRDAWHKQVATFQNRSTAFWYWQIVREFLTQCGEKCCEFIMLRAGAVARLAKRIGKRTF
jgi:hypothetical protein